MQALGLMLHQRCNVLGYVFEDARMRKVELEPDVSRLDIPPVHQWFMVDDVVCNHKIS